MVPSQSLQRSATVKNDSRSSRLRRNFVVPHLPTVNLANTTVKSKNGESMSVITKISQNLRAQTGLSGLNRRVELSRNNPEQVIGLTFEYNQSFLRPIQEKAELLRLLEDVINLNPRVVLEIGTALGGTLYLWTRF